MNDRFIIYNNDYKITQLVTCTLKEVKHLCVTLKSNYAVVSKTATLDFILNNYTYSSTYGITEVKKPIVISKSEKVRAIKVTASTGKVFDGDEKSQDRMTRAINIAAITGATSTKWKLADNTIVSVTLDELKEALALSGQAMSDIWLA